MSDPVMDDLMRANARVFELESEIASLRQRQEALEAQQQRDLTAGLEIIHENQALRTQLQQTEQEHVDEKARADRLGEHATELFGQLQQAETALRRVEDIARPGCAGVHGYEFSAIVREVQAVLAAPPADAWKNAQQRLRDFPGSPKEILPGDYPTSSQEKP